MPELDGEDVAVFRFAGGEGGCLVVTRKAYDDAVRAGCVPSFTPLGQALADEFAPED